MKHINKLSLAILLLITIAIGCKKDEKMVYFEGGTAPVLTSTLPTGSSFTLKAEDSAKSLLDLSWTNPNYKFTTGTSSQDVTYVIEMDSAGKNFAGENKVSITVDPVYSLTKNFTVSKMNNYLLALNFDSFAVRKMEIRIKAYLNNNNAILYSNTINYMAKAYPTPPKVAPPSSGRLFIIGDATPGGWPNPVPEPAQEFTRIDATTFELTISLTGGNSYLLLPVNGSWNDKYGGMGANNTNNVDADDFKRGGGDLKAPAASGTYKIVFDFQKGRYKLTKL
jgi:hypothetical protein